MTKQDHNGLVRIAALGDLHYTRSLEVPVREVLAEADREADVLLLCGDLTDHGYVEEAQELAREIHAVVSIPVIAVLGNHDFESGRQEEVKRVLCDSGIRVLDGDATEVHGVGFAGVKGFCGGFGRRALGPWGEDIIKHFVREAVDEALKLEAATALFGGIALYLLGHVAFRLRTAGGLNHVRLVAAVVALACVPLGTELNAVAALAVACALVAALIAYETVRFAADRARVRLEA